MTADSAFEGRPKVTLPQGVVVGVTQKGRYPNPVDAFLGVPYALPPTGDRRLRPPVKVEPSSKTIDASKFGPRAPARLFVKIGPVLEESEDCLTANIFRPAGTTEGDGKLPVALYFHGGAFNRGNSAMWDSSSFVGWSSSPFIAVSFGYRIGALGFLPSVLSAKEGALNLGLKDQILLMEWVQENISQFGGDKNNVTLIGLSAGAHSIGHHLLNYEQGQKPLFNRVVMESGAPTSRAVRHYDAPIHEQQFSDFLKECKVPKDMPESEVFTYLRSLPSDVVTTAQTTVFYNYNPSLRWAFQPVIDGEIIRQRPIDAWRKDAWHKVPIISGFQGNEGSLYVDKKMETSTQFTQFWKLLLPQLTDADLAKINTLYPDPETQPDSVYKEDRDDVGKMYKRIEAAYAHYAYVAPARQTAHLASPHVPVYLYHWALRKSVVNGAAHGENMMYEVRDEKICAKSVAQEALSGVLHAYITSFICTGDPNETNGGFGQRAKWEAYGSGEKSKKMVFGKDNLEWLGGTETGEPSELVDDVWAKEESDFWWDKVEISQQ